MKELFEKRVNVRARNHVSMSTLWCCHPVGQVTVPEEVCCLCAWTWAVVRMGWGGGGACSVFVAGAGLRVRIPSQGLASPDLRLLTRVTHLEGPSKRQRWGGACGQDSGDHEGPGRQKSRVHGTAGEEDRERSCIF